MITELFLIDASLWQAKEGGFSEIHIFVSIKFLEAYIYCSGLKLVEECKNGIAFLEKQILLVSSTPLQRFKNTLKLINNIAA